METLEAQSGSLSIETESFDDTGSVEDTQFDELLTNEGAELNVFPLSFAQERLWFLEQLRPGTGVYNLPAAVRITGELSVEALAGALDQTIERHEILRTVFASVEGRPVQAIDDPFPWPLERLEVATEALRGEALEQRIAELAARPFDLEQGPLVRATLLSAEDQHVLLLVMHHIVTDGWSMGVLVREIASVYEALAQGRDPRLVELPIQYVDFTVWQREELAGEKLERDLDYWRGQLAGLEPLDLPTDHLRTTQRDFRGEAIPLDLGPELSQALLHRASDLGVPPFALLLASLQALLARRSGRRDVAVGTPVANRTRSEIEGLIGFFVNTLVLRTSLAGDPSFRQLVERVGETTLDAWTHQDLPFEKLVAELEPDRQLDRNPFFQVLLVLHNEPLPQLALGELALEQLEVGTGKTKLDLTFALRQEDDALRGALSWAAELFERATILELRDQWLRLLGQALADPERPLSQIELLTSEERQQLVGWSTGGELEGAPASVLERFEHWVETTGEATALAFEGETLSYAELGRRVHRLAHHLRALGVGPEERVALLLDRRPEMIVTLLGVLAAGGAYVPLDPAAPVPRLAHQLGDSGARWGVGLEALVSEDLRQALDVDLEWIFLDTDDLALAEAAEHRLDPLAQPDSLAYVMYTSGSTGRPKGVAVEHRQLAGYVAGLLDRLGLEGPTSFTTVSTLAADLGNTSIYAALTTGGCLHLISEDRVADGEALAEIAAERSYDGLKIVPSHLAALLDCERPADLLPRKFLVLGGEAASWELIERIESLAPADMVVINHYGPTEATVGALAGRLGARASETAARPPIGRPLAGAELHLLDRDLAAVPIGAVGQVHLGGVGLSRGYLGKPAQTAAVFVPHPTSERPGNRLYATGDAARFLADGRVEFLGRIDRQVKIRGFRVEPGEVETVLHAHPGVRQAVVLPIEGPTGTRLAAFVVASGEADPDGWRSLAAEQLTDALVPSRWIPLDEVPLTPNGKIDRRALLALAASEVDAGAPPSGSAPRTPSEEILAGIWSSLLARQTVTVDDDFFDLGGHSLLATQVLSRIRRRLGIELPLRVLFETPTLGELAGRIDRERQGDTSLAAVPSFAAVPRDGSVELPLSFAQERLWLLHQIDPDQPTYNLPYFVSLEGDLDVDVLRRSLERIVARHEVLRTVLDETGSAGRPVQRVLELGSEELPGIELEVIDLAALDGSEQQRAVVEQRGRVARHLFDLGRGPLFVAVLLDLGEGRWELLMTLHHIVSDAWSRAILTRELQAFYGAERAGSTAELAELPIQYGDYAHGQRRWLQGEVLEAQLDYWRGQLDGVPALELPTDRPRPAVRRQRGAHAPLLLGRELSAALSGLGRRRGATLFMVVMAAFQTLLHRLGGQRDFAIGSPVANRNRAETEGLIGMFINMLVLRTRPTAERSFGELLEAVRETSLGAYDHQDMPFERLVEELAPARDLSRTPLFQAMLILQNTEHQALALDDLALRPLLVGTGTAKYDLTLVLEEGQEGLQGALEYDTDLFDDSTAQRWLGHFRTLLEGIVASPEATLGELPMLTAGERRQILEDWNATTVDHDREGLVHQPFEAWATAHPEARALVFEDPVFEDQVLTYDELARRVHRLAHYLRGLGVGPDVRVALFLERSPELVVALLAVLEAGGAYVPVDTTYPEQRIALVLDDAAPEVVLTRSDQAERLSFSESSPADDGPTVVRLDALGEQLASQPETAPESGVGPHNLAYVIYTSGSTGRPKGVMVQHANVLNFFTAMDAHAMGGHTGGDTPGVWLAVTSVSFDISVLELLWTLGRGFEVVLLGDPFRDTTGRDTTGRDTTDKNTADEDAPNKSAPSKSAPSETTSSAPVAAESTRPIDFSLFYFASDAALETSRDKYRLLMEGAKWADRNGFEAVWTPERHFNAFGGLYPNPPVVGAAIAAVTENIRIRAGSVVLPLQHPVRVAEDWSVVDNLSGGRVDVSFASGWHADDFIFAPDSYEDRRDIMFRSIETVRALWRGETRTFPSWRDQPVEVALHPRPLQEELPIWVTAAGSPTTFEKAGEIGAGLLTHLLGQNLEEMGEKIARYRSAWRRAGHAGEGCVTVMLHTFVGRDLDEVRSVVEKPFCDYLRGSLGLWRNLVKAMGRSLDDLTAEEEEALLGHAFGRYFDANGSLLGTPETCLEQVERLRRLGVDEVGCLIDFGVDADATLEALDLLGEVRRRSQPAAASGAAEVKISEASAELATTETREMGATRDDSLAALLRRHRVTHLQCTPSMARMLTVEPEMRSALESVHTLLVGGEALPEDLASTLDTLVPGGVHNMYGPTETTVWSTTKHLDAGVESGSVTLGQPVANTQIYLCDPGFRPVPVGVAGELLIGGEGVVRGYSERAALTAERFVPDPFATGNGERLYRTGDLARYRPDGEIEFLGRVDHQIKVRGHRIEPGEIEAALVRHPRVDQAVVVGREDRPGDHRLVAYVVPTAGSRVLRPALSSAEQERLLSDHKRYVLPNGMLTAVLDEMQASLAYTELYAHRSYFRHGIALSDGDRVFDAGANVGFFTLNAHLWARDLEVHAFEPIPPTFRVLSANAALYGLDVRLHNHGLSWREEEADFTFYPLMSGLSGRYSEKGRDLAATRAMIRSGSDRAPGLVEHELDEVLDAEFESETHRCRLRSLSQVIDEEGVDRIDLLKVDVERAELDVLRGVRDEHWPLIRQVVMEIDTRANLDGSVEILAAQGFAITVEELVDVPAKGSEPAVFVAYLYARREGEPGSLRTIAVEDSTNPDPAETEPLGSGLLRRHLEARLPPYMVPSVHVVLDRLPLTPNGKIDRRALPEPEADRPRLEASYEPPATDLQRSIAEVWQELLRVERVGVHDNFFELGGSSLLLVEARTRMRDRLGIDVTLVDLFRDSTIAALATRLEGKAEGDAGGYDKVREQARQRRTVVRRRRPGGKGRGKRS